jgi:hypothetical protein
MANERKEILVLDGMTILFIVMLVTNGVLAAMMYRWHNIEVFKENVLHREVYGELLKQSRELKNALVEREGALNWNDSASGRAFVFRERGKKTFTTHGLTIDYPGDYASQESVDGTMLTLMSQADAERLQDHNMPPTEGPTTITIGAFPLSGKSLLDWVQTSPDANFNISKKSYVQTKLNTIPAISYEWSGLYEAIVYAVETPDQYVLLFTVTYGSRGDDIVRDFDLILSTLQRK